MSEVVHIRISEDEADAFHKAAKVEKMKLSSWMRRACAFAAERIIKSENGGKNGNG